MHVLEVFVLSIPYLFLMKIPYAWILAVAFFAWPPYFSAIVLGIVLLGMYLMRLQKRIWIDRLGCKYRILHLEQPGAPLSYRVLNLALLTAGAALR
jgi:hypothetical protein